MSWWSWLLDFLLSLLGRKNRLTIQWSGTLVSGTYTAPSGKPIANASVILIVDGVSTGASAITNNLGQYSFAYPFKPGTYTVQTESGVVLSPKITITVTSVLTTITLSASATAVNTGATVTFSGKATDGAGNPMAGVTLHPFNGATALPTVVTAADGTFSFQVAFNTAGSFQIDVSDNATNT